jgi:ankyrin repeat protein
MTEADNNNYYELFSGVFGPPRFDILNPFDLDFNFDKNFGRNFYQYCDEGQFELAKNIYNKDNDVNEYCFVNCCERGYFEIAKWLYGLGVDFNLHKCGSEAVIRSCKNGHFEIVKWLYSLETNANINYYEAFTVSCKYGHIKIAKWLYDLKLDVNFNYSKAFEESCSNGHVKIAKLLRELNNVDDSIKNAFILACANGHLETIQWLHLIGANIRIGNDWALRISCRDGKIKIAKMLYNFGANIHTGDEEALRLSLVNGHFEIISWLHSLGTDVCMAMSNKKKLNQCFSFGTTDIFSLICLGNHFEIAEWICNLNSVNGTVLKSAFEIVCARRDNLEIVKQLYSCIYITDTKKINNAFVLACKNKNFETARWLLSINSLLIVEFLSPHRLIEDLLDEYTISDLKIGECLDKLGYDGQTIVIISKIVHKQKLDQCDIDVDDVDDIILHILAKYSRIDDIKKVKHQPHMYISYDVVNNKIVNFSIKRIRVKSAQGFNC